MTPLRKLLTGISVGALFCGTAIPGAASDYDVGSEPGMLANIGDVPWESLAPGDWVLIHWRAEPYREKWVICRRGTAENPIVVSGIPGPGGELPVIDGRNATTRLALSYWNEVRGVVKIGAPVCRPTLFRLTS